MNARSPPAPIRALSEQVMHAKQRVLIARLMELEGTFRPMLAPQGGDTPYSVAVQEITKHEMARRAPPACDPRNSTPISPWNLRGASAGGLEETTHQARVTTCRVWQRLASTRMRHPSRAPSPLEAPLPGQEARRAAVSAAAHAVKTAHAHAAEGARTSRARADTASTGTTNPLSLSTSLPMLRTRSSAEPLPAFAQPLPVARGSVRVAARKAKGVSAGTRSEIMNAIAMHSRAMTR